jgi:hypothetical protein
MTTNLQHHKATASAKVGRHAAGRTNPLRRAILAGAAILALTAGGPGYAQNPSQADIDELRGNVDVFTNVLKEGLGLNTRTGAFSPRQGDVRGRYLAGQGIVLDITTPLQGGRNAVSAQAVNNAFQDLSVQLNNLMNRGALMRPDLDSMREAMALSLRSDEVAEFYREQLQRLSAMEDFSAIDRVLATASASLQGLHSLGEIDASTMQDLSERLREMRRELMVKLDDANTLRREMREQSQRTDALPDEETQARWQHARDVLRDQLAQLHERAMEQAEQLQARNEQISTRRAEQWRQDVQAFEVQTFAALCDYAGGLRALPDNEYLTIVLVGLGEDAPGGGRRDRIHVVSKQDLLLCQRGDIDNQALRGRAASYSF